jgi:hypothetical protein
MDDSTAETWVVSVVAAVTVSVAVSGNVEAVVGIVSE